MARLITFVFDVPVVAIFAFLMFYIFKVHDFRSFAIATVFIGIIPLFAWTHLIKHPGDFKGERKLSFIIDAISYPLGLIVLLVAHIRNIYTALVLSYLLNVMALTIINKAGFKASGHGAGIAGPATALTIEFGWLGALSFLLLVPVGIAKIRLKDHTVPQFLTGAAISAALTYISFVIMRVI